MEVTNENSSSSRVYTIGDILSGVNKLEAVIELEKLKDFQLQLSAAIGLAFDFFNHYQTYLLAERRQRSQVPQPVAVTIIPMLDGAEGEVTKRGSDLTCGQEITPVYLIGCVCQSLHDMHHLIQTQQSNFLSFSYIICDLITSIAHIMDLTEALSSKVELTPNIMSPLPNISTTSKTKGKFQSHWTLLPRRQELFFPPSDLLQQLMNLFGHFKNATSSSVRNLDQNVVLLTGESGYGKT